MGINWQKGPDEEPRTRRDMMSEEYVAKMDGRDFKIEVRSLNEGGSLTVKIGDETFTMKPSLKDDGTWTVSDTSSDHTVKIVRRAGKSVSLELDGKVRGVDWEHVRKEDAAKKADTPAKSGKRVSGGIYPPMPGKISDVRVKIGDKVESGQTVCILEAMKMFNELKAPLSGTVKEVNVKSGSMVALGDLLVLVE
jgi:biotin carboxyl carrier protein